MLSLRVWSLCSAAGEAVTVGGPRTAMKSGPHLPQLEKALPQKRRPNTAKKKKKKKVIIQSCRFWNAQELAAWAAFWQRLEGPSQQSIPWGYVGDIVRQLWKSTNLFLEKALSVQICRANSLPGELNRWSVRGRLVVRAWGFSMGDEGGHVPAFFKQLKLAS